MKTLVRTGQRKAVKRFPIAHLFISMVVAIFGIASTLGVLVSVDQMGLDDEPRIAAMALAGSLAFTIAMIPVVVAPAWVYSRPAGKVAGFALIACMMMFDGGFQINAGYKFEALIKGNSAANITVALHDVRQSIAGLPTAVELCSPASGEYVGPQRCDQRKLAVQADREALRNREHRLLDELGAATASDLPIGLLLVMVTGFQLASFFLRVWLTGITKRMQSETETPAQEVSKKGKTYSETAVKGMITKAVNEARATWLAQQKGPRIATSK